MDCSFLFQSGSCLSLRGKLAVTPALQRKEYYGNTLLVSEVFIGENRSHFQNSLPPSRLLLLISQQMDCSFLFQTGSCLPLRGKLAVTPSWTGLHRKEQCVLPWTSNILVLVPPQRLQVPLSQLRALSSRVPGMWIYKPSKHCVEMEHPGQPQLPPQAHQLSAKPPPSTTPTPTLIRTPVPSLPSPLSTYSVDCTTPANPLSNNDRYQLQTSHAHHSKW